MPPTRYPSFSSLIISWPYLVFSHDIADAFAFYLIDLNIPVDDAHFMKNKYIPELKEATKDIVLPLISRIEIIRKYFGAVTRIYYGTTFVESGKFNENTEQISENPYLVALGGYMIPFVNWFASTLSGYVQTDEEIVESRGLYPG